MATLLANSLLPLALQQMFRSAWNGLALLGLDLILSLGQIRRKESTWRKSVFYDELCVVSSEKSLSVNQCQSHPQRWGKCYKCGLQLETGERFPIPCGVCWRCQSLCFILGVPSWLVKCQHGQPWKPYSLPLSSTFCLVGRSSMAWKSRPWFGSVLQIRSLGFSWSRASYSGRSSLLYDRLRTPRAGNVALCPKILPQKKFHSTCWLCGGKVALEKTYLEALWTMPE